MGPALSSYDKYPTITVTASAADCREGWEEVLETLAARARQRGRCVLAVECYPGVDAAPIRRAIATAIRTELSIEPEDALHPPDELERMLRPYLGPDPVFGFMCPLTLADFFAPQGLDELSQRVAAIRSGVIFLVGTGASLVAPDADVLVYADLTRWEIRQRQRRGAIGNLGADNRRATAGELYKRAYFVDWRAADRHRSGILDRIDFYLDANVSETPRMVTGRLFRRALALTCTRPFRLVPFFDPGPWGGEWMRAHFDLPNDAPNFAWGFDCVPEENSLLFGFGSRRLRCPALTLVHQHPQELLGRHIYDSLGAEFPIRFDLLDTMDGGNLSLQVHPLRSYIEEKFGLRYTQDESYYLLDAKPGAVVYLGLNDHHCADAFERDLRAAHSGGRGFPAETYVDTWPAQRHDHYSIPAGTIHCSGKNSVVLEISATPYIFTFKLWDWDRLGLDGQPRPIHLEHGLANIQWDRTSDWVARNLVNPIRKLAASEGVREESTGLHRSEFIETRRHWFTRAVDHATRGTVNVLNLVEGDAAVVDSPNDSFEPLEIHFAETFVVPAAVGSYRVRPLGPPRTYATIKAFVRGDFQLDE